MDDQGNKVAAEELLEFPQILNRGALVRVKRRVYQVSEHPDKREQTVLLRYPAGAMISLEEAARLQELLARGK